MSSPSDHRIVEGAPRGGAGKLSLRSCDGDVMLRLMHGASWVACVLAVCTVLLPLTSLDLLVVHELMSCLCFLAGSLQIPACMRGGGLMQCRACRTCIVERDGVPPSDRYAYQSFGHGVWCFI